MYSSVKGTRPLLQYLRYISPGIKQNAGSLTTKKLQFPRYSPDKIFKLKVTTARSNQGHTMTLHSYCFHPWCPDGWAGGRREIVCPGCISETVRCRKLILGRDMFKAKGATIIEIKGFFNMVTQLNLEPGVKHQIYICKRFAGHDFLQVDFTFAVLEPTRFASV